MYKSFGFPNYERDFYSSRNRSNQDELDKSLEWVQKEVDAKMKKKVWCHIV